MVIGLIDIVVILVLIISILFAIYRGLICELMGITSWIIAGIGALYGYTYINDLIKPLFTNESLSMIISGLSIALVIIVLFTIVNTKITNRLRQSALSQFDRSLGFIFGIVRAILVIAVVYIVATVLLPRHQINQMAQHNFTLPYIEKMVDYGSSLLPDNIQHNLNLIAPETPPKSAKKTVAPAKKSAPPKKSDEPHAYDPQERTTLDDIMTELDKEND